MSRRDDLNAALSKVDKRTKIMIGVLLLIIVAGAGLLRPEAEYLVFEHRDLGSDSPRRR